MSEDVPPYGSSPPDNAHRVRELRDLAMLLPWSQRELARRLEVDERELRHWFTGRQRAPVAIVFALRYLTSPEGLAAIGLPSKVAEPRQP